MGAHGALWRLTTLGEIESSGMDNFLSSLPELAERSEARRAYLPVRLFDFHSKTGPVVSAVDKKYSSTSSQQNPELLWGLEWLY